MRREEARQQEETDPKVVLAVKKRRRLQIVILCSMGVLLVLLQLAQAVDSEGWGFLAFVVIVPALLIVGGAFVVVRMITWRYPACKALLKGFSPVHCDKCGAKLQD